MVLQFIPSEKTENCNYVKKIIFKDMGNVNPDKWDDLT